MVLQLLLGILSIPILAEEAVQQNDATTQNDDAGQRLERLEKLLQSVVEENRRLALENQQIIEEFQKFRREAANDRASLRIIPPALNQSSVKALSLTDLGVIATRSVTQSTLDMNDQKLVQDAGSPPDVSLSDEPDPVAPIPLIIPDPAFDRSGLDVQNLSGMESDLSEFPDAPVDEDAFFEPPPIDVLPPTEDRSGDPVSRLGNFQAKYRVGYDSGFALIPEDFDESPFTLKIDSRGMVRLTGFRKSKEFWTNSAGVTSPIDNFTNFQIPRGRLIFTGNAFLPELTYLLNIDFNTVTNYSINFFAYSLSYRFSRYLEIYAGLGKVPGARHWLMESFAAYQGPDYAMSTTFFRPSLSQGVWFKGEPMDHVFYHAMLANGFNTENIVPGQLNDRFALAGSAWWEPLGAFGTGYSDVENHKDLVLRVGASYTFAAGEGNQSETGGVENSAVRLSDGTLVSTPGALAPGVTLNSFNIGLAAFDIAAKYRGVSLCGELYLQRLSDFKTNKPLPFDATNAWGGFLQGGFFILPQTLELYSRSCLVSGAYGSGTEVAGGFNWYILKGKNNLRSTLDGAWLDNSPAQQARTDYVAGQSGLLLRAQFLIIY